MNGKFSELYSTGFLISREMIENHGEDNFYFKSGKDSAVICVLDGCGGLGSCSYDSCGGETGAYLASRTVSGAVHDWYHDTENIRWKSKNELLESLMDYIGRGYSAVSCYAKSNIRISGSMVRDLPTTIAMAFICHRNGRLEVHIIWAGDSRIYLLDEDGLCQLTRDDVNSRDALSNLSDDGALTNVLSSDMRYVLHHKMAEIKKPSLIIGATDGCFGYLPSPMNFEYEIISALTDSASTDDFQSRLTGFFDRTAGDDFTFACMGFGYGCFEDMRRSFLKRREFLEKEYMRKLGTDPDDENLIFELWQNYRTHYERYLSKN